MTRALVFQLCAAVATVATVVADYSDAAVLRYRQSGDWTAISDGSSPGWANNDGSPSGSLPGAADDARINFGNNTVTVTTAVPTVNRVQIGVDESGNVTVSDGGVLAAGQDILAGNNNSNATGTLTVNDGGVVDVGRILWAAQNDSDGAINVESGGIINVASHLWWGVTGTAEISISGTINQTGGILGLGTNDAATPTGGTATVNVLDGGLLALNNISGNGTASIQPGSIIDISGTGRLTVPDDRIGSIMQYADAGLFSGYGVVGNVVANYDPNTNLTTVTAIIPEPSTVLLLVVSLGGVLVAGRR